MSKCRVDPEDPPVEPVQPGQEPVDPGSGATEEETKTYEE